MPSSPRQRVESVAATVFDEYRRTGFIPPELIRHIQVEAWRKGRAITTERAKEQFADYLERWAAMKVEELDRQRADGVLTRLKPRQQDIPILNRPSVALEIPIGS